MDTQKTDTRALRIVLISGLSGAGKTLALKALEDREYFSIDNLPSSLLDPLVLLLEQNAEINKVALVMDARDPEFHREAEAILESLKERGHSVSLLFLEASTDAIIRRFAETRRPHPMGRGSSVEKGVAREKKLIAPLRDLASHILDTSTFNVHQLKAGVLSTVDTEPAGAIRLIVASFGFKYGVPLESAFTFDVRYLPNPFFVDALRKRTGLDKAVSSFVLADKNARLVADKMLDMIRTVLPLCEKEGRSTLMVAIGCTGGQHRSVAIAEAVADTLRADGIRLSVMHRDIARTAGQRSTIVTG